MNREKYIQSLAPEMQERMRACDTVEDMLMIARQEGLELPDEALDAVYGGGCGGASYTYKDEAYKACSTCNSRVNLRSVGHQNFPNVYFCPLCYTTKDPTEVWDYSGRVKVLK